MFLDWFFAKNKPSLTKYPAYLGHTVYQSEYDALKAECDRAHKLNVELQKQLETLAQVKNRDIGILEQKYNKLRASYDMLAELHHKLDQQLLEKQHKD